MSRVRCRSEPVFKKKRELRRRRWLRGTRVRDHLTLEYVVAVLHNEGKDSGKLWSFVELHDSLSVDAFHQNPMAGLRWKGDVAAGSIRRQSVQIGVGKHEEIEVPCPVSRMLFVPVCTDNAIGHDQTLPTDWVFQYPERTPACNTDRLDRLTFILG